MNTNTGQLKRDGKVVFEGTEGEAMAYIHRNHSFSYGHALLHEGYSYDTAEEVRIRLRRPEPKGEQCVYCGKDSWTCEHYEEIEP